MSSLADYRNERLRKLAELRSAGFSGYPSVAHRTHMCQSIIDNYSELESSTVTLAGRVTSIRKFGKLAFVVVRDSSGSLQLFLRSGDMASKDAGSSQLGIEELPLLDTGDFIEATGTVMTTQTGEKSIGVSQLRLLTKALRPLPDELTNKEERLRRRYVDMNVNEAVRERFKRRSAFWQATRNFLLENDFIEINIPVLEATAGGADANPFTTHMDALDQDFYLRISHELPLKRLLVAGFERVFDIGPRFRNENYSDEHLPEHIAMEWYWAYADWKDGMRLTTEMIQTIVKKTWGNLKIIIPEHGEISFESGSGGYARISFVEVLQQQFSIDVFSSSMEEIQTALRTNDLEVEQHDNRLRSLDKLWKHHRKTIIQPVFLVDIPTFMQPLAKVQADNPKLSEQFNLVFAGSEMCKAYSELNDPLDQYNRFMEQQRLREQGDDEAQMMDIDYVEALEYGMPPACGFGLSERVFWALEGVSAREGVPFAHLRPDVDQATRQFYPEIYI